MDSTDVKYLFFLVLATDAQNSCISSTLIFDTVFKTIRRKNIVEVFLLFTFLIGVYFFNLCNSSKTTFSLRNLHICFSMKNWDLLYFPNSKISQSYEIFVHLV